MRYTSEKPDEFQPIASNNTIAKIRVQNQPSEVTKKENPTHIIDASVIEIIDRAGQQFQINVKRDVTYQQTETDVEHTARSSL